MACFLPMTFRDTHSTMRYMGNDATTELSTDFSTTRCRDNTVFSDDSDQDDERAGGREESYNSDEEVFNSESGFSSLSEPRK